MQRPRRFEDTQIQNLIQRAKNQEIIQEPGVDQWPDAVVAGSGPIGSGYVRTILDSTTDKKVMLIDIGSQDSKVIGEHHKNSIKYQKDIDTFVNVIKGALQPLSYPPADTFIPTLVGDAWTPPYGDKHKALIFHGSNPFQEPQVNLKASAVTRTVGGMATHWTCAVPLPHEEEIERNPIPPEERKVLYKRAEALLNIHDDQYEDSIRHTVVKKTLEKALPNRGVKSLPLAVERRKENPEYVTWTGSDTILGDLSKYEGRFQLKPETRVTKVCFDKGTQRIGAMVVRDLKTGDDFVILADAYIICCGAVCTPQILANSGIIPPALGRNLCEQSLSFCQIVLRKEIVDSIWDNDNWKKRIQRHLLHHPADPLPIPFSDPEPQVMIPYHHDFPWHCQIHRDAFSYGEVGPRADPRVVVDLRFFGRQEINWNNRVFFEQQMPHRDGWIAGNTDTYGMPQPTFEVTRSPKDSLNDQRMMKDMCAVADLLGAFLPGSQPQFMEPGLALHITGTTRIGTNKADSVANPSSIVHDTDNLWVGGNGNIPDSTGCNPTYTSLMIALKGADAVVEYLNTVSKQPKEY